MGQRVEDTARAMGVSPPGRRRIARSYALAMEPRRARLGDDHDPAYLHPGRCAVILMDDLTLSDPVLVSASALVESEHPELAVSIDQVRGAIGWDVAGLVAGVPGSGREDLAERLVVSGHEIRILALVERLDQLRHAHLWADAERRREAHAEAKEVYLPVAERTDPTLARRYRRWCSMFARRHLEP